MPKNVVLSSKEGNTMYFLDNASTTKVLASTQEIINKFNTELFFNPSAKYAQALNMSKEIDLARDTIKDILNTTSHKVIFTGSATEANNLAILGSLKTGKELIISEGEHSSVYNTAKYLETQGRVVHYIPLNNDGTINEEAFLSAINPATGVISIIHTSNETGAINNIERLCKLAKQKNKNVLFHTDIVQAFCKVDVDLEAFGVDMATISAHKIHGPKGVGALVTKKEFALKSIVFGGGQESGIRSGTENVSGIVGFANSAKEMFSSLDNNYKKVLEFRSKFIDELNKISNELGVRCSFNLSKTNSPYILSLAFWGIRGEILLHALEKHGVLVGTGSACSSHVKENRVLRSAQKTYEEIDGNLRISFEPSSCEYDINNIITMIYDSIKEIKK